MDDYPDAYMEGFEAFYDELDPSQCPYEDDSHPKKLWMEGYQDAEMEYIEYLDLEDTEL